MARRKPAEPAPPPPEEKELAAAAARRLLEKDAPPTVAWTEDKSLGPPHADIEGWQARLLDLMGTRSSAFMCVALGELEEPSRHPSADRGDSATQLNAALAFVSAIAPRNEVEAALAIQMQGTHSLAALCLGRAKHRRDFEGIALFTDLAVKLTRAFAVQTEALARLRGDASQKVEVRYVHVEGNALFGDVQCGAGLGGAGQGGGGGCENRRQPHEPCGEPGLAAEIRPALPGAFETVGSSLSGPGDARQEVLPVPRRRQPRRSQG